jgi:hypothetical protein
LLDLGVRRRHIQSVCAPLLACGHLEECLNLVLSPGLSRLNNLASSLNLIRQHLQFSKHRDPTITLSSSFNVLGAPPNTNLVQLGQSITQLSHSELVSLETLLLEEQSQLSSHHLKGCKFPNLSKGAKMLADLALECTLPKVVSLIKCWGLNYSITEEDLSYFMSLPE